MLNELLQSPIVPILTFLIGLVVGHWFAIHRDKRKEYNELIAPLRKKVASEAFDPSTSIIAITRHDADAIGARLNIVRNFKFMKACERYWKAKEGKQQDKLGQPFHTDENAVRDAAKKLLKQIPFK